MRISYKKLLIVFICAFSICVSPICEAGKRSVSRHIFKTHKIHTSKYVNKALTPRPKFRKSTIDNSVLNAPKDNDGNMICATCNEKLTGKKVNGRRDFDIDHNPTWESRKQKLDIPETTRKDVIEAYQKDVRIQCPTCNRSHKFEGGNSFLNSVNNNQNLNTTANNEN